MLNFQQDLPLDGAVVCCEELEEELEDGAVEVGGVGGLSEKKHKI